VQKFNTTKVSGQEYFPYWSLAGGKWSFLLYIIDSNGIAEQNLVPRAFQQSELEMKLSESLCGNL
jgi:hypothetical protein